MMIKNRIPPCFHLIFKEDTILVNLYNKMALDNFFFHHVGEMGHFKENIWQIYIQHPNYKISECS